MKTKTENSKPATRKISKKSGLAQVLRGIKSIIMEVCKENRIVLLDMQRTDGRLMVEARVRGNSAVCPHCGQRSGHVHSYRQRRLQCTEQMGLPTILTIRMRRFECRNPECTCRTFSEPLHLASRYMRMTHGAYARVMHEAVNQTAPSAVESLAMQHISTSKSTCHRILRRLGAENPSVRTSGYIGIDDFAMRKGHDYGCMIVDHHTGDVLAVFDTRYGPEIGEWLAGHQEIKLVSRDGCQTYASIITQSLPSAVQVSDRFHLVKNMRDTVVDMIMGMLERKGERMRYPYPTEQEAYDLIFQDMLAMGAERHRRKVHGYFQARRLRDEGNTLARIGEIMSVKTPTVSKLLETNLSKILSPEQKTVMRFARRMASLISAGRITPESVHDNLDGGIPSELVHRSMRSIKKKYKELRDSVRRHNKELAAGTQARVSRKSVWKYIRTGTTASKRLRLLGKTNPQVEKVINACIRFCRMIHNEKDAPDVATWVTEAKACQQGKLTAFAEYIDANREAVTQGCKTRYSNAILEGNVNRCKAIKRSMYNRAGINVLRAKLMWAGRKNTINHHQN